MTTVRPIDADDEWTSRPAPDEPGTLRQQLDLIALAAENPWQYERWEDAYAAARRVVLHHARRVPR